MVEQPVNGVEKIVFVERVYSDIYYAQCNARNETIMMVVYGQAKTLSRTGCSTNSNTPNCSLRTPLSY